jgi:transposase
MEEPGVGIYDYRTFIAEERAARALIERLRWPQGIRCPRCGAAAIWQMAEGRALDYRCAACRFHLSVLTGTFFAGSHLTLGQWVLGIGLWKVGISARSLAWALGTAYRTARRLLHCLREAAACDEFFQRLSGEIEVDDTYSGGRRKGKRGRGARGKIPVVGLRERDGRIKSLVVPDLSQPSCHGVIRRFVLSGSVIYSDDWSGYAGLSAYGYRHEITNHQEGFLRDHLVHTQSIESYWAHTKPDAKARHHRIGHGLLQEVLAENDFRFNHRHDRDFIDTVLRFLVQSHQTVGAGRSLPLK